MNYTFNISIQTIIPSKINNVIFGNGPNSIEQVGIEDFQIQVPSQTIIKTDNELQNTSLIGLIDEVFPISNFPFLNKDYGILILPIGRDNTYKFFMKDLISCSPLTHFYNNIFLSRKQRIHMFQNVNTEISNIVSIIEDDNKNFDKNDLYGWCTPVFHEKYMFDIIIFPYPFPDYIRGHDDMGNPIYELNGLPQELQIIGRNKPKTKHVDVLLNINSRFIELFFSNFVELNTQHHELDSSFFQKKYLKYKNRYQKLKNNLKSKSFKDTLNGGQCNPIPDQEDVDLFSGDFLVNLSPEKRITIQNKCYEVNGLYTWIVIDNQDRLPDTRKVITDEDIRRLIEAYERMIDAQDRRMMDAQDRRMMDVPQFEMDRETILDLITTYPTEIINLFISQYEQLPLYNTPDQVEDYKNFIIDLYQKLIEQIRLYQAEDISIPITIVTVGNSPYKITRLIELFNHIENINFIYLPFSGKFNDVKKVCSCNTLKYFKDELVKNPKLKGRFPIDRDFSNCTPIRTTIEGKEYLLCHWNSCKLVLDEPPRANTDYMETYLDNPEKILNELNEQYTPAQQEYFEQMIINSELQQHIDANHKIILIDYLEFGVGFLSFLITLDKYLIKRNTIIFGLVSTVNPVYNHWKEDSTLLNNRLILNKYEVKYIKLDTNIDVNYELLLYDSRTRDRCVKSYKKNNWIHDYYKNFYLEENINNCNIALLNMALILLNNRVLEV